LLWPAREDNEFVYAGMIFQKAGGAWMGDPPDVGIWMLKAQRAQRGKRVDNIANGA
jgi:hypothetical protein